MKLALQCLFEPFLSQYFLFESVFGGFITPEEKEKMKKELRNIFCIPRDKTLDAIIKAAEQDPFDKIRDIGDYERLCRTIEFAESDGQDLEITAEDRLILDQKREAMTIKAELFKQYRNLTEETVYTTLITSAMNGNIKAMTTLGYMEYHGICISEDKHNAYKRIRLSANWNDLFGNLMGIAYDKENRQKYYDVLYTVLSGAVRKGSFAHICEYTGYNGECSVDKVAKIIERAFGLGEIKRGEVDHCFAHAAFSELIPVEDKEKLLLSNQPNTIAALADIPFGKIKKGTFEFDGKCADKVTLVREDEIETIVQNLTVAKRCSDTAYRPLLIIAGENYVSRMYLRMIKDGAEGSAIYEIDASTLTDHEFSPTKDNIIISTISATKSASTLIIIKNADKLTEAQANEIVKYLDNEFRRKFRLFSPPVSLDLSGIRFVLTANGKNFITEKLSAKCDTVEAADVADDEKEKAIDDIFEECLKICGVSGITLDPECKKELLSKGADAVTEILDDAVRYAMCKNLKEIKAEDLKAPRKNKSKAKRGIGFSRIGGNV